MHGVLLFILYPHFFQVSCSAVSCVSYIIGRHRGAVVGAWFRQGLARKWVINFRDKIDRDQKCGARSRRFTAIRSAP